MLPRRSGSLGLSARRYGGCTVIEATTVSKPNTHRARSLVCWPGSRLRPASPHLEDSGTTHFNLTPRPRIDCGARRAAVRGYTRRARRRCRSRPKNVRWTRWTDSWCRSNAPCPGSPSLSPSSPAFPRKTPPICSCCVPDTVCQADLELPQCRRRCSPVDRRGAVPLRTTLPPPSRERQIPGSAPDPTAPHHPVAFPMVQYLKEYRPFWRFDARFGAGSS